MNKIYVVVGSHGSYEDYSTENICAFLDEEKALKYAKEMELKSSLYQKAKNMVNDNHNTFCMNSNWKKKYNDASNEYYASLSGSFSPSKDKKKSDRLKHQQLELIKILDDLNKNVQDERIRFINSLDFLSDEERDIMASGRLETDNDYSVETLELKD